jgi:hypothetical protein
MASCKTVWRASWILPPPARLCLSAGQPVDDGSPLAEDAGLVRATANNPPFA